jgi:alkylhydroperoxidase family enzyme
MNRTWKAVLLVCALVSVSAVSTQGPGLNRVMRKKLTTSQKILEAVVTSNWISLEAQSKDLEALTNDPGWMVLKAPEYAQQSATFRQAVRALREAAVQRDLEATPQAYIAVTLGCVQCHRYLARNRLARE